MKLYRLYQELDIVKRIKVSRLRWVGRVMKMHEDDPTRKHCWGGLLFSAGEEDQEQVLYNIEEHLRIVVLREWRRQAMNGDD